MGGLGRAKGRGLGAGWAGGAAGVRGRGGGAQKRDAFLLGFSEASASHSRGFSFGRGWGSRKDTDRPLLSIFLSLPFFKSATGGNSLSPPPFHLCSVFLTSRRHLYATSAHRPGVRLED